MAVTLVMCLLVIGQVVGGSSSSAVPTAIGDQVVTDETVLGRVVAQLEALIRINVHEVTSGLSTQLASVSDRLDSLSGVVARPAEDASGATYTVSPEVIPRLAALEQSLNTMLRRQEGLMEAAADAAKLQGDAQQAISDLARKNDNLQETVSVVSDNQHAVQETLSAIETRQEGLKQSISVMLEWQSKAQTNFSSITDRQNEVQQSLSAVSKRQKAMQDSLSSLSDATERTFSDFVKFQDNLQHILENISEKQDSSRPPLSSSSLEGSGQETLESISEKQGQIEWSISLIAKNQEDLQRLFYSVPEITTQSSLGTRNLATSGERPALIQTSNHTKPTCAKTSSSREFAGRVLGEYCRGDTDCSSLKSDSVCGRGGRCQCQEGFQEVAGGFCRPHPKLTESCRSDRDCEDAGTECVNDTCVCVPDLFNFNNTECRPYPHLSEECIADSDCQMLTAGAVCEDSSCTCPVSLLNFANRDCRPFPGLSESCREDSDCRLKSEHAVCSGGICTCPSSFWNHNNTECRPGVGEGGTCSCEKDCATTHLGMSCVDGICTTRTCESTRTGSHRFRLYGGTACDNGLVQFTRNGGSTWVFACDMDWTDRDASAMCRDMGYRRGTAGVVEDVVAPADPLHWEYRHVDCSAFATSLLACNWREGYRHSCPESELPFVTCHAF